MCTLVIICTQFNHDGDDVVTCFTAYQ